MLFDARDDERSYGLGQQQHGRLSQKGTAIELVQRHTEVWLTVNPERGPEPSLSD